MRIAGIYRASLRTHAFTMIEIAIAIAVIAFALVAIIGVLPAGMQVQKENKEETLIAQDGTYFMQAIRNGTEGMMESNKVERILTNGVVVGAAPYTGYQVIGLLSTPGTNKAIVRGISGPVSELGAGSADLAFRYELTTEIDRFSPPPEELPDATWNNLTNWLYEVRLRLRWPVIGTNIGNNATVFRTLVSGTNVFTNGLFFFTK